MKACKTLWIWLGDELYGICEVESFEYISVSQGCLKMQIAEFLIHGLKEQLLGITMWYKQRKNKKNQ